MPEADAARDHKYIYFWYADFCATAGLITKSRGFKREIDMRYRQTV